MMTRPVFFVLASMCIIISRPLLAQTAETDSVHAWKSNLEISLTGAQAGFDNWVEGGTSSFAGSVGLDGSWERTTRKWTQHYEIRLRYGLVKQDTLDFRKAEDEIFLMAAWSGEGSDTEGNFHPTAGIAFRSQFYRGFNFKENPIDENGPIPVQVSAFMSPGKFQETLGITWKPSTWFTQHVGVASKQTIIFDEELRELYGSGPDETVRVEVGINAVTRLDIAVAENVRYKSSLGLFARFNSTDMPDTRWDNMITMAVNGWLRVTFEWVVLFDVDVSDQAQFREIFGVGISYAVL